MVRGKACDTPVIDMCNKVKIADVEKPKSGLLDCYMDRWWVVTPDDEILFYQKCSPQCNADEGIAKNIRDKIFPGLEVRQIPVVFLQVRASDQRIILPKKK
jgi:hypothetical protein